jgi:SnoaL-like domain
MSQLPDIQNQINRYTSAVNRRDWQALADVFAAEGTWECIGPPALKFEGQRNIVAGLKENITRAKMLVQMNTPAVISVRDARASAHSTMFEVAEFPQDEVRCEIFGMYEDELIPCNGSWLFQSRAFTIIELRSLRIEGKP